MFKFNQRRLIAISLFILILVIALILQYQILKIPFTLPETGKRLVKKQVPQEVRVKIIVFDPVYSDSQYTLSQRQKWGKWKEYSKNFNTWMQFASDNKIKFTYDENKAIIVPTYAPLLNGQTFNEDIDSYRQIKYECERSAEDLKRCGALFEADYKSILNNKDWKICEDFNNNIIDEVWMFGGPWFGFSESALAGPKVFDFNGALITDSNCNLPNKVLPIMGYSYEAPMPNMIHNYGHRMEALLNYLFERQDKSAFQLFSHSNQSSISGCGNIHYPPNTSKEYIYNSNEQKDSYCPVKPGSVFNLTSLNITQTNKIDSSLWLKDAAYGAFSAGTILNKSPDIRFYTFWFKKFPNFQGLDDKSRYLNWWEYVRNPSAVLSANIYFSEPQEVDVAKQSFERQAQKVATFPLKYTAAFMNEKGEKYDYWGNEKTKQGVNKDYKLYLKIKIENIPKKSVSGKVYVIYSDPTIKSDTLAGFKFSKAQFSKYRIPGNQILCSKPKDLPEYKSNLIVLDNRLAVYAQSGTKNKYIVCTFTTNKETLQANLAFLSKINEKIPNSTPQYIGASIDQYVTVDFEGNSWNEKIRYPFTDLDSEIIGAPIWVP